MQLIAVSTRYSPRTPAVVEAELGGVRSLRNVFASRGSNHQGVTSSEAFLQIRKFMPIGRGYADFSCELVAILFE